MILYYYHDLLVYTWLNSNIQFDESTIPNLWNTYEVGYTWNLWINRSFYRKIKVLNEILPGDTVVL